MVFMMQQIQQLTKELHSSVYVGNFLTPIRCVLKFGYLPKLTVDEIKRAAHVSIILQLTDFRNILGLHGNISQKSRCLQSLLLLNV